MPVAPPAHATAGVAVTVRGLSRRHGAGPAAVVALDSVDVDVAAVFTTIMGGPSGSGTPTPLHCLAGLDVVMMTRDQVGASDADRGTFLDGRLVTEPTDLTGERALDTLAGFDPARQVGG
ncbi:hypothetical protein QTQ03_04075 [Micromonospora sp. WMMA1363]|uniref:hypothetical protein n=1 Tax=Micromonospora sp. WMMA1363 TaxID=3053985 RepID=UPI00259D016D|nr:hypothetical protein [Micromonospora sp. WMMA1363]MDM4718812.1 hypothetical protein [Micromonospora sp. WMMA1363]